VHHSKSAPLAITDGGEAGSSSGTETGAMPVSAPPGRSSIGGPKTTAAAHAVKDVAVSTLVALGEVQMALFQAGVALVDNASTATADIVSHKVSWVGVELSGF
jgi:hypothetical protein